jgi:DNA-binding GntR family transcriptional regulator
MKISEADRELVRAQLSRKDAVAVILRRAIVTGKLVGGTWLDQDQIALELGVSRMPVREALKNLEAEGLVSFYPYKGVQVKRLTVTDVEEVFGIRMALERLAMRRAVPRLTAHEMDEMKRELEVMDASLDDPDRWIVHNESFHGTLYHAAGWPQLEEMITRLRANVNRYVRVYVGMWGRERPQQEHWAIYRACEAGDALRVEDLNNMHLQRTATMLVDTLSTQADAEQATETTPEAVPWARVIRKGKGPRRKDGLVKGAPRLRGNATA